MFRFIKKIGGAFKRIFQKLTGRGPKIQGKIRVGKWLTDEAPFWVNVVSSYVTKILYDSNTSKLYVNYLGRATCRYDNISMQLAKQMFFAPSIGRFARKHLFPLSYVIADYNYVVRRELPSL